LVDFDFARFSWFCRIWNPNQSINQPDLEAQSAIRVSMFPSLFSFNCYRYF